MINLVTGDLLKADVEAIVNTVNTVGVAGKGIALQMKRAYPEVNAEYERAAAKSEIVPGRVQVVRTNRLSNPRYVINFPTKRHWKAKSRLSDIESGLLDLVRVIREFRIRSIAVPPLGCGNGGLNWSDVRPRIVAALEPLHDVHVQLFVPAGAPAADTQTVRTKRPNLTPLRASLVRLIKNYRAPGYRLGLLEGQKLGYFWDRAGDPTDLGFVKGQYGPYSEKLNFVFQTLEGHYLRGYGDRSGKAQIQTVPGAATDADQFLLNTPDALQRVERVERLIEGFENPYGMELLSSVHWITSHDPASRRSMRHCIEAVYAWNERKRNLLQVQHIEAAWRRLRDEEWLTVTTNPDQGGLVAATA